MNRLLVDFLAACDTAELLPVESRVYLDVISNHFSFSDIEIFWTAMLLMAQNKGHLYLPVEEGVLREMLPPGDFDSLLKRAMTELESSRHVTRITSDELSGETLTPVILREASPPQLSFHKNAILRNQLRTLLQRQTSLQDEKPKQFDATEKALRYILKENPVCPDGEPIQYDPLQILAMLRAWNTKTHIVSGGPGTGKTSVIFEILRGFLYMGIAPEKIALAAPTGKAANRLSETITRQAEYLKNQDELTKSLSQIQSGTLHKLLGAKGNDFQRNRFRPLAHSVILVDEASMIDARLMRAFLEASRADHLILVGDRNQLPSVDAGAVFGDLTPENNIYLSEEESRLLGNMAKGVGGTAEPSNERGISTIFLEKNFRSNLSVSTVANAILRGDSKEALKQIQEIDQLERIPEASGVYLLRTLTGFPELLSSRIVSEEARKEAMGIRLSKPVLSKQEDPASYTRIVNIIAKVNVNKILTALREGPRGAEGVNSAMSATFRQRNSLVGVPVMITRNDYSRGLFNGDVGVILRTDSDALKAAFQAQDSIQLLELSGYSPVQIAFAITIHKSQGSEYDEVFIVLPEQADHPLLSRELLYTAITRARKKAVIIGSDSALKAAIEKRTVRYTGLLS